MRKSLYSAIVLMLVMVTGPAGRADDTRTPALTPTVEDPSDSYLPLPGDKVAYSIKEDPIKGTAPDLVMISPLSQMRFRVSNGFEAYITIDVRGKTIKQIREEVKKALDEKYYQNATVVMSLEQKSQRAAQVFFTGQVRNGVLSLKEGSTTTLYEALVQVGFTEFADLTKVKINRVDPQTKAAQDIIINVKEILKKGKREKDPALQDGDRVDVPEKRIVF